MYSVAGNKWSPIPDMNVSRYYHGSCAVANYIYVACGVMSNKSRYEYLQSIERVNMNAIDDGWEILLVSSSEKLSPRRSIFMAGLSCDKLVIFGGEGEQYFCGDGYILDIPKMRLKTIIRNTDESMKFAGANN